MAVTTNVPPVTFGPTGFTAPAQADVLAGVQADIDAAFGGGLNPSLSTPQGQLASTITAIIGQANDSFVNVTNQMNPAFASGIWQDAIGEIYFLQRNPSQPTVVQALCTGGAGVVIDVGALALAVDGNIYTCTQAGTIPVTGSITLPFSCNVAGPIACPAGTLSTIYRSIFGWDSITNVTDGVLGVNTESRTDFEARRVASVGINSNGSLPSVLGAVLNVAGVLDAYVTENTLDTPASIGGVTLAAHSLYVAVVGGTQAAVAQAIWSKKAPGCNYNGNTTVVVQDTRSGYSQPYPSYNITYQVPSSLPILYAVNIASNPQVPTNATTLIQNALIAAFAGADGGPRARIGSKLFATRYLAPLAALGSWMQVISLQIGSANVSSAVFVGSITGTALTVTSVTSGIIAIGQTLSDAAGLVLPGTTIVSGSGTSWVVSNTQTVGSRSITGAMANTNSVTANINQVPTINANNIAVTLS